MTTRGRHALPPPSHEPAVSAATMVRSPDPASRGASNGRAALHVLGSSQFTWVAAILGISLLALRRWVLIGPFPPGLDGAQWVALGRGLHGFGRATAGAYAPLVPILATIGDGVAGPLLTVRFLATLSTLAVTAAVWLVARAALGAGWGLLATAAVIPASALAEPVLYGGYPQQFALAAGVIALWATCRFLTSGERRQLWLAGCGMGFAAASHHVYGPIVALSIATVAAIWSASRPDLPRLARLRALAMAAAPGCTLAALVLLAFSAAGYAPPLDASARSALDAWRYATRESPEIWGSIVVLGGVSLAGSVSSRGEPAWLLAAGLVLPAGTLFLISGQPRLAPPIMVAAAVAVGLGARRLAGRAGRARAIPAVAAAMIVLVLIVPADRAVVQFSRFYQIADQSLVNAAEAITAEGLPGAVAVRQDRRGWPIGWWFEALLDRPVIVGSDPQWLAFPEELQHASLADRLFVGELSAAQLRQLAAASGIRYLVMPKWDWIGWERWTSDPEFPIAVVYDDDEYLALRVT